MKNTIPHIALLVFNQTPLREALRKSSVAHEEALRVFSQSKAQVIRYARASGLKVFDSALWQLEEGSFAQNLRNAVQRVLEKGFTHVLVIGIDIPGLSQHHIAKASQCVEEGHHPVGPDHRGGAYLLTFDTELFNSDVWLQCRWESPYFLEDWLRYTQAHVLPKAADIQTTQDFEWVKLMVQFRWMLKALKQQLILHFAQPTPFLSPFDQPNGLRAPPHSCDL